MNWEWDQRQVLHLSGSLQSHLFPQTTDFIAMGIFGQGSNIRSKKFSQGKVGNGWKGGSFLEQNQVLLHCYCKKEEWRVSSRLRQTGFNSCFLVLAYSLGEVVDLFESHCSQQNVVIGRLKM